MVAAMSIGVVGEHETRGKKERKCEKREDKKRKNNGFWRLLRSSCTVVPRKWFENASSAWQGALQSK
jgi:hypothetical protein